MLFVKIPRHTRQNAITEGDLECILARNCEGTEQLRFSFDSALPVNNPQKFPLPRLYNLHHRILHTPAYPILPGYFSVPYYTADWVKNILSHRCIHK